MQRINTAFGGVMGETRNRGNGTAGSTGTGANGGREDRRRERRYPKKEDGLFFANWMKEGIALATTYGDTTASFETEGKEGEYLTAMTQGPKSNLVKERLEGFARMVAMSLGYWGMEMKAVPPPREMRERLTEWFRKGCQAMVSDTTLRVTSEATCGEKGSYLSVKIVCPEGAGRLIGKKGATKDLLLEALTFVARGVGYNPDVTLDIDGADRNIFAESATGSLGGDDTGTDEPTGSEDPTPTSAGTQ